MNSRSKLIHGPYASTKESSVIIENVYKPGFIDNTDPEVLKMGIDYELNQLSNAFQKITERGSDFIKEIRRLDIADDNARAMIEEEWLVRANADEALAQVVRTVQADFQTADAELSAKVTEETRARSTADEAMAQKITNIETEYKAADVKTNAAIRDESTARSSADQAMTTRINAMEVAYKAADANLNASIKNEETARVTADEALASKVSTVEAEYKQADVAITKAIRDGDAINEAAIVSTNAKLTSEETARATADAAIGQRINTVEAQYKAADAITNNTIVQTNARLTAEEKARADGDEALSSRLTQTVAEYKSADTTINNTINGLQTNINNNLNTIRASITNEETARANADAALTSSITFAKSELSGLIASVSQEMTTVTNKLGVVESKWTITTDTNGRVSGVSLINGSNAKSEFAVRADRFRFVDTSGNASGGFTSSNGVTTFNGTVNASGGVFNNCTIGSSCTINGTLYAEKIVGDISRAYNLGTGGSVTLAAVPFRRQAVFSVLGNSGCNIASATTTTANVYHNGGHIGGFSVTSRTVRVTIGGAGQANIYVPNSWSRNYTVTLAANTEHTLNIASSLGTSGTVSCLLLVTKY